MSPGQLRRELAHAQTQALTFVRHEVSECRLRKLDIRDDDARPNREVPPPEAHLSVGTLGKVAAGIPPVVQLRDGQKYTRSREEPWNI